jgi:cation diffusion facilitator family transporter
MSLTMPDFPACPAHSLVILGDGHDANKRRAWWVIALCAAMMVAEIVGGLLFGSIALVADGLHMSTHAGALLLAALAYTFASRHATDGRFTFGTGKLGDLAGFSSAIVLAMIAMLIGYEAISRFFAPVPIAFSEAIPIAVVGLIVNIASVLLLSGGNHQHHHGHGHGHDGQTHDDDDEHVVETGAGQLTLGIFENGVPSRFRVRVEGATPGKLTIRTVRPDGGSQLFQIVDRGAYWESLDEVPEPHEFEAVMRVEDTTGRAQDYTLDFEEHAHGDHATHRDNNMRAAIIHVMADAAVSLLVIVGLIFARIFGWLWLDPLAGMVGAIVIAVWSYSLVRDTGAILLDMIPDRDMAQKVRAAVESEGDELADFHLWRLGPGHLGVILSVVTTQDHGANFYRAKLARFPSLSHVTVELVGKS